VFRSFWRTITEFGSGVCFSSLIQTTGIYTNTYFPRCVLILPFYLRLGLSSGLSLNIYRLKFDTSFSPPNNLQNSHLSNSPSFKHLRETCENVRWMELAQNRVQFWTARERILEWGFRTEKLLSESVCEWGSVSESVRAGSSRSVSCQVSLPETQTAGNSSSSPGSWPLPIPATRQSSRLRHRKCWHKTPVELIKLCHPLLTPYVTTTILREVLISW
jgi:hypothetical protein